MKKLFVLFSLALVFTLFTTSAIAQENLKPKTQEEINAAFCYKWRLTAMEDGGMRLPPSAKADFFVLILKSDGTFIKTTPNREEVPGEWIYKSKGMLLQMRDKDGVKEYMIMKITEKEFTYKVKIAGTYSNMVMTRVEE